MVKMIDKSVGVVIQARMGSTRLPGKSLMTLGAKPLIDHVIDRCLVAAPLTQIFLATSKLPEDKILADHVATKYGITVYRGDKTNVRSRFEAIAKEYLLDRIVRITADDPFKDPTHILEAIQALDSGIIDYFNNFEVPVFPIGLDVESFRTSALLENILNDSSRESKEHVTLGLRNSTNIAKKFHHGVPEYTHTRLTIDTPADLEFCEKLIKANPEIENSAFEWDRTRAALIVLGVR